MTAQDRDALVGEAAGKLSGDAADIARALFGASPIDDLAAHDAASLAAAATLASDAMARKGEGAEIDVSTIEAPGGALVAITVVDADRPFVVDSTLALLREVRADIRLVAHPVIERDGRRLSVVQVHCAAGSVEPDALRPALADVMVRVDAATDGWRSMLERIDAEIERFAERSQATDTDETVRFLKWLRDGNIIFLGMRDYDLAPDGTLERSNERGRGILADPAMRVLRRADGASGRDMREETNPQIKAFLTGADSLIVTKANTRSVVHRRAYMDYVGLKRLGPDGALSGELRIVGLFTSSAYSQSVLRIPYLAGKVRGVLEQLALDPESHSGKELLAVLESYPRDELFQIDVAQLTRFAAEIVRAMERPRARVLARVDRFNRFVSAIVLVPKERYDSRVRERIGEALAKAYDGHVSAFYPDFPEGPLARVHIVVGRDGSATPEPDMGALEAEVERISADWESAFSRAAAAAGVRIDLAHPIAYREAVAVENAVEDARRIAALGADGLDVRFRTQAGSEPGTVWLRLIRRGALVPLSRRVPILEAMGFMVEAERTYRLEAGKEFVFVHDMAMRTPDGAEPDDGTLANLDATFVAAWSGRADADGFNALALTAGMAPDAVRIVRAYSRYLRQTGIAFSQSLIEATVARYPTIAADLYALFAARLDPNGGDGEAEAIAARIETALDDVPSLDEDRILRRLLNAVRSTWRTNAYRTDEDGIAPTHLAFKLDPKALTGLPEPRPFAELFVYGPQVEGVHLRFGPVARGGLRWSDRAEDYRTEVLGLVKAQQVKNAVIVPVGAKGGFYPRQLPGRDNREAWFEAGRSAYVTFITTLLSVTDNIVDGEVVGPENVARLDGDDPYFVVAADKGTATFSDTANGIAQSVGFWLDDAFASGGSAGYDHKAMGITARGAWVAVQRHFREMGRDIQTEPFTVAGVGDMSGDVFGNGMLLSPVIRLVAAFDHRDIFVDPTPDPAVSFEERRRLFEAGRSSWQDYDRSKLSIGGGIHSRSMKTVDLSPEARALLDLGDGELTPSDVMTAILKARVDLMWFGGIGTYVKARHESHAHAGDRANDAIRIDGHEARALAMGEGANLGLTQDGRVEYALLGGPEGRGGAVNSDAIDNSAGVNSSDVEVNIKIALADAMRSNRLTREDRNELLVSMTDDVAALVLDNNYEQTLGISIEQRLAAGGMALQRRLMQSLEVRGLLDRAVENLPDDAALDERRASGGALTRPEIGILVSYAKLTAFDEMIASDLPDDPALADELTDYFPPAMRDEYSGEIARHRLRREIIATRLVNRAVNRAGPTLFVAMADRTGAAAPATLRAFEIAHVGLGMDGLFDALHALDTDVHGEAQNAAYAALTDALRASTLWALRHASGGPIDPQATRLADAMEAFGGVIAPHLPAFMADALAARAQAHREAGLPDALAVAVAPRAPHAARARCAAGSRRGERHAGRGGRRLLRRHRLLPHRAHRGGGRGAAADGLL